MIKKIVIRAWFWATGHIIGAYYTCAVNFVAFTIGKTLFFAYIMA